MDGTVPAQHHVSTCPGPIRQPREAEREAIQLSDAAEGIPGNPIYTGRALMELIPATRRDDLLLAYCRCRTTFRLERLVRTKTCWKVALIPVQGREPARVGVAAVTL